MQNLKINSKLNAQTQYKLIKTIKSVLDTIKAILEKNLNIPKRKNLFGNDKFTDRDSANFCRTKSIEEDEDFVDVIWAVGKCYESGDPSDVEHITNELDEAVKNIAYLFMCQIDVKAVENIALFISMFTNAFWKLRFDMTARMKFAEDVDAVKQSAIEAITSARDDRSEIVNPIELLGNRLINFDLSHLLHFGKIENSLSQSQKKVIISIIVGEDITNSILFNRIIKRCNNFLLYKPNKKSFLVKKLDYIETTIDKMESNADEAVEQFSSIAAKVEKIGRAHV